MKRLSKRTWILLGVVAVAAVAAIGGYAYFTATGSGTGTATVGSASNITISGSTTGNLYPGGPGRTVAITLKNPGAGNQYVTDVSLDSITSTDAGCDTSLNSSGSAFTFANPVVVGVDLDPDDGSPGGTDETTVNGTLTMNDTGVSQDDCQGESLTLNFSST